LHNSTYQHLTDYGERIKDALSKINYFVVKDFIPIFNAPQKENFYDTWGWLDNRTNRYTALFVDILYRTIDLGCLFEPIDFYRIYLIKVCLNFRYSPIFMMPERIGKLGFLKMNTPTLGRIVFRAPQLSSVANLYTLPFNKYVWFSA
jgi:hypothetical protein